MIMLLQLIAILRMMYLRLKYMIEVFLSNIRIIMSLLGLKEKLVIK